MLRASSGSQSTAASRTEAFLHAKATWVGQIGSVQPRIRLTRSFDQRTHSYLGYVLCMSGTVAEEHRVFTVDIGVAAHTKHQFRVGDEVSGNAVTVTDSGISKQ